MVLCDVYLGLFLVFFFFFMHEISVIDGSNTAMLYIIDA